MCLVDSNMCWHRITFSLIGYFMPILCWLLWGQIRATKQVIPCIGGERQTNSHGYGRSDQDHALNSVTGLCQLPATAVIGVYVKEVFPLIFVDHREAQTSEEQ